MRCLRRAWGLALRADDSRGPARIAAGLERALRRRGAWAAALLMADAGRRRAGRRPAEPPEDGAATGAGEAGARRFAAVSRVPVAGGGTLLTANPAPTMRSLELPAKHG